MPNCIKLEWLMEPQMNPCAIGEPANCNGLQVQASYDDGTQDLIEVTPRMLNESSLQTTVSVRKSMIVYAGQKLPILVPVLDISLDHIQVEPKGNLQGREGELFDRKQVKVTAFYSDGSSKLIEHYKTIPGKPLTKENSEITIRYGRCSETFPITVLTDSEIMAEAPAVDMQVAQGPSATAEEPGREDRATEHQPENAANEPQNSSIPTIVPEEREMPGAVTERSEAIPELFVGGLPEKVLQVVSIAQMPAKLKYSVGDTEADLSGGKLNLIYTDGTIEQIEMAADGAINLSCSISGRGCVAFTYREKLVTYPIEVTTPVVAIGLELTKLPKNTFYEQGSVEVDLAGAEVAVRMSDGTSKAIPVSTDMIGPFDFTKVGPTTLLIMHQGFSVLCPVTVVERASVIAPVQPITHAIPHFIPQPSPVVIAPKEHDLPEAEQSAGEMGREEGGPEVGGNEVKEPEQPPGGEADCLDTESGAEEQVTPAIPQKDVPDFYISTFGLRFTIDDIL